MRLTACRELSMSARNDRRRHPSVRTLRSYLGLTYYKDGPVVDAERQLWLPDRGEFGGGHYREEKN